MSQAPPPLPTRVLLIADAADAAPVKAALERGGLLVGLAPPLAEAAAVAAAAERPAVALLLSPGEAPTAVVAALRRSGGGTLPILATDPALSGTVDAVLPVAALTGRGDRLLQPLLNLGKPLPSPPAHATGSDGELTVAADGSVLEHDARTGRLLGPLVHMCWADVLPAASGRACLRRLDPDRGLRVIEATASPAPERRPGTRRVVLHDLTPSVRQDALHAGRAAILERIARGEPLPVVLEAVIGLVEAHYPQWMCSVLRLSEDGMHLLAGAAPRIPATFSNAIDGARIGPCAGSCGTAAFHGRAVVVDDIAHDPLWADYRSLALPLGLRACWSLPVFAGDGRVLGTFATYAAVPCEPDADAMALVEACAHLAAVALERARTEEALAASRQRLEAAQRIAHLGHYEHHLTEARISWSVEACHLLGIDAAAGEEPFARFLRRVHRDDRAPLEAASAPSATGSHEHEFRIHRADGALRIMLARSERMVDAQGRPSRDVGVIMDVTESRQAQHALMDSEERFRSLFEHHPDAVYALDADGHVLQVNRAFRRLTGIGDGDVDGQAVRTLVPAPSLDYARSMHARALAGESLHFELDCLRADGSHLALDVTTLPIVVGGRNRGVYGIARDVTRRKAMQQRLRDNEQQLRVAGSMAQLGSWSLDLSSGRFRWSEQAARLHDLAEGSTLGSAEVLAMCLPEHRPRMTARIEACATEGVPFDEEFEIRTRQERRVWLRAMGDAVRADDGRIVRIQGAVQDITERREAEARVQAVAARLSSTLESITDAFVTVDRAWCYTYANAEAERLLQQPRGALLGASVWKRFPSLLRTPFERRLREAMESDATVAFKGLYAPLGIWFDVRAYPSAEGLAIYFRDVTEQQRAEAQLKMLDACVARMNDIVMITEAEPIDDDGPRILFVNDGFERRTGYRREEVIGRTPRLMQGPLTQRSELDRIRTALKAWQPVRAELINYRKNGEPFWLELDIFPIAGADGRYTHWAAVERDIDERKRAERTLAQQAALLDNAQDAIIVRDMQHRIQFWNRGAERLFGWPREAALGRSVMELLYPQPESFYQALDATLAQGDWSGELEQQRSDRSRVTCESRWTLVRDADGQPQSVFVIHTDITERKRAEREIHDLAFYDPLTRLPNRALLLDRLEQALASHAGRGGTGALLFIDMDNFKALNDTLGHDKGDELLREVAKRLRATAPDDATVARLGGDEFVVMLETLERHGDVPARRAQAVAEMLLCELDRPYQLDGNRHHGSASIGVTLFNDQRDTSGELLKRADLAMYQAKAAGRNTMCFFDPQMQAAVNARAAMEKELREALRRGQFCLHYQPQVDHCGRPFHAEVLVRWQHPERGLVSPAEFTPLAEETGLIVGLGQWVLEQACWQLQRWRSDAELARIGISVNVSARQFRHPEFVQQVLDALERTGAEPSRLQLELTESLLLTDVEDVVRKMGELRSHGVRFSLDDFGTGYSSLAYLKRLPFDQLKIDQSFVTDVLSDPNDAAIARTIVALGRSLGLGVVAEGVETEAQRARLAEYGCHAYQGFLFSRPLDLAAFEDYLRECVAAPSAG